MCRKMAILDFRPSENKHLNYKKMESKNETENEEPDWMRKDDVTGEEVLKTEGLEYLTTEQAEETAQFVRILGALLFVILEKEQQENKVIDLHLHNEKNKAA